MINYYFLLLFVLLLLNNNIFGWVINSYDDMTIIIASNKDCVIR